MNPFRHFCGIRRSQDRPTCRPLYLYMTQQDIKTKKINLAKYKWKRHLKCIDAMRYINNVGVYARWAQICSWYTKRNKEGANTLSFWAAILMFHELNRAQLEGKPCYQVLSGLQAIIISVLPAQNIITSDVSTLIYAAGVIATYETWLWKFCQLSLQINELSRNFVLSTPGCKLTMHIKRPTNCESASCLIMYSCTYCWQRCTFERCEGKAVPVF
jgi:hypothetical protein